MEVPSFHNFFLRTFCSSLIEPTLTEQIDVPFYDSLASILVKVECSVYAFSDFLKGLNAVDEEFSCWADR